MLALAIIGRLAAARAATSCKPPETPRTDLEGRARGKPADDRSPCCSRRCWSTPSSAAPSSGLFARYQGPYHLAGQPWRGPVGGLGGSSDADRAHLGRAPARPPAGPGFRTPVRLVLHPLRPGRDRWLRRPRLGLEPDGSHEVGGEPLRGPTGGLRCRRSPRPCCSIIAPSLRQAQPSRAPGGRRPSIWPCKASALRLISLLYAAAIAL